jgi:predicted CoA-binding protein
VGVRDAAAIARATGAGLLAVEDRCLAVDYRLLLGGR